MHVNLFPNIVIGKFTKLRFFFILFFYFPSIVKLLYIEQSAKVILLEQAFI